MSSTFFLETLPRNTADLLSLFNNKRPPFLQNFYLSGGTALSLQIGHRESEDLDFFSEKDFLAHNIETKLKAFGNLSQTELSEDTLNTFLDEVKLQFLFYPYPLIQPLVKWGKVSLSSVADIACTKLQTISMRGSKKDFIDLYFLLKKYRLSEILSFSEQKYKNSNYNVPHILKSLVYFVNAEKQPMPKMHKEVSWNQVKRLIAKEVSTIQF